MGRIGPDHYFVRCEPDPGEHRFSNKSYYFCFAIRNPMPVARMVRIRVAAAGWNYFGRQTRHYVVRRGDTWRVCGDEFCRGVHADNEPDTVEIDVLLPPGTEADPFVVVSNFHWNRYTEFRDWLATLPADKACARGHRSADASDHRPRPAGAPAIFLAQTSQLGTACMILKAMIGTGADTDHAAAAARGRGSASCHTNLDAGLIVSTRRFQSRVTGRARPDTVHEARLSGAICQRCGRRSTGNGIPTIGRAGSHMVPLTTASRTTRRR